MNQQDAQANTIPVSYSIYLQQSNKKDRISKDRKGLIHNMINKREVQITIV